jgi:fimbrial chaperone protein
MIYRLSVLAGMILASSTISGSAYAGGVGLSATRVIYDESASQASLPITNSDTHEKYLIQAWVEDNTGKKSQDFVVTPPLFSSSPKSENTLRIMYLGKPLPKDREKVYWMNVKAIPAVNPDSIKDKNSLQLAILSRIKLFMRPEGLAMGELEAMKHLHFQQANGHLTLNNPTPYYQTLVNLSVGGKKLPNQMVDPEDSLNVPLPAGSTGEIRFQIVNDYGALSAQQSGQTN